MIFLADALTEILRAASKHPNSRVSKLIHTVEDEPNQKNIVLLLIELAEHAEYSIDFNISLKYVSCIINLFILVIGTYLIFFSIWIFLNVWALIMI